MFSMQETRLAEQKRDIRGRRSWGGTADGGYRLLLKVDNSLFPSELRLEERQLKRWDSATREG